MQHSKQASKAKCWVRYLGIRRAKFEVLISHGDPPGTCNNKNIKCHYQCCVFRIQFFFIPDPDFFHPGSRIFIKEFKYFKPEKWFLSSCTHDPGCSSRIRILTFYPSRIPGSKRHRIPDPEHWSIQETFPCIFLLCKALASIGYKIPSDGDPICGQSEGFPVGLSHHDS